MAAIVTNNLKKQLLQTIVTDISADSANYYYIGIKKEKRETSVLLFSPSFVQLMLHL
jgi:hypothetical protein